MDFTQIVTLLKQVTDAIQKMENSSNQTNNYDADEKMILLAKQYPLKGHYLVDQSDNVRKSYLVFLLAFCNALSNQSLKQRKMYYIGRIISSFDKEVNLEKYITQSLNFDMKNIYNLIETLDSKAASYFSVDLLVLFMLDADNISKNEYEIISDILQFLKISINDTKKVAHIAKAIVKQDANFFFDNINQIPLINYDYFLGYFSNIEYTSITNKIEDICYLKGNALVVNTQVLNYQECLEMSDCTANVITFKNCLFKNIKGFRDNKQKIIFDDCTFENTIFDEKKYNDAYDDSNTDSGKVNIYIQGNNIILKNCTFSNIWTSISILNIDTGEIDNCTFEKCRGYKLPYSYLFQLKNVKVTNNSFNKCTITTNEKDHSLTTGGIVKISNGFVENNLFDKCEANGKSGYGRFSHFEMQIVKSTSSTVENNTFNNCSCSSDNSYDKNVGSYILGLNNSIENNNKFIECSSYHYYFGDIMSNYDIGEIE